MKCEHCGHEWKPVRENPSTCPNRTCRKFLSDSAKSSHLESMKRRYQEKRVEIVAKNIAYVKNMDPVRRAEYEAYQRAYKRGLSPEQRDAKKKYNKKYRQSIDDAAQERSRARWREWKKTWTDAHREARKIAAKKWYSSNPESIKARNQKRRALKKNSGGSYTVKEWRDLVDRCGHKCVKCGRGEPEIKLTVDHIVPICKGGSSNIENIQPLCLPCNLRKHDSIANYLVGVA